LYALFEQENAPRSAADEEEIEHALDTTASAYELCPYPWAGAISTHHTFLHFLEFGPGAFRKHFQPARDLARKVLEPPSSRKGAHGAKPSFPLAEIVAREQRFLREWLARALYTTLARRNAPGHPAGQAPISLADFEVAAQRMGLQRRERTHV
jgi:hypothetical protein